MPDRINPFTPGVSSHACFVERAQTLEAILYRSKQPSERMMRVTVLSFLRASFPKSRGLPHDHQLHYTSCFIMSDWGELLPILLIVA
jgi:hypothetical protein